jgi:hypothetical protein
MATPRIIFFDLETRKWAKDLRPDDEDAGWDELREGKGGASAIAIYDTHEQWVYLYDDNCVENAARHIEAADIVVGYCSSKFDIPCIEGLIHRRLRIPQHIDLYVEIVRAHAAKNIPTQKGDLTLDRICKRNIGRGKIDHGSNARELARKGHWGKLFNYCVDDVHLTHDLYYKMVTDGGLIGPRGFISLPIEVPS